jgi:hypothetical protein
MTLKCRIMDPIDDLMAMEADMAAEPLPLQTLVPPAGFTPPDDAMNGKPFDAVVKLRMEGGELVVESINGIPMDESDVDVDIEEVTESVPEPGLQDAMRASGIPM